MGIIDDYLNGLEGQENLNPLDVASRMLELHKEEIGTRDAKIAEQDATIADREAAALKVSEELVRQKAKNFDLAMQIPGARQPEGPQETETDPDAISIDDLFKS